MDISRSSPHVGSTLAFGGGALTILVKRHAADTGLVRVIHLIAGLWQTPSWHPVSGMSSDDLSHR
jgi:hypothetical protein